MLYLYGTSACHLCDEALLLLSATFQQNAHKLPAIPLELEQVDITQEHDLFERYGERIPVLASSCLSEELDWPFAPDRLLDFLRMHLKHLEESS